MHELIEVASNHSGGCCKTGVVALNLLLRAVCEPGPGDAADTVLYSSRELRWTQGEEGAPWWACRPTAAVAAAATHLFEVYGSTAPPGAFVSSARWPATVLKPRALPRLVAALAANTKKPEVTKPIATLLGRLSAASQEFAAEAVRCSALPALLAAFAASRGAVKDLSVEAVLLPALAALDGVPGVWADGAWTAGGGGSRGGITILIDAASDLCASAGGGSNRNASVAALARVLRRLAEAAPAVVLAALSSATLSKLSQASSGSPWVLEQLCHACMALHGATASPLSAADSTTASGAKGRGSSLSLFPSIEEQVADMLATVALHAHASRSDGAAAAASEGSEPAAVPRSLSLEDAAGVGFTAVSCCNAARHSAVAARAAAAGMDLLARVAVDAGAAGAAGALTDVGVAPDWCNRIRGRFAGQVSVLAPLAALAAAMAAGEADPAGWGVAHAAASKALAEASCAAPSLGTSAAAAPLELPGVTDAEFETALEATFAEAFAALSTASGGSDSTRSRAIPELHKHINLK